MRRIKALAALAVLLLLLIGVPAALAGTIGNPATALPDLRAGDMSDAVLIALLASVAWIAWAQFALATIVELASAVRRSPMPRRIPGVLAGQQQLARSLVTAVFLLGPVAATATLTGSMATGAMAPHALAGLPDRPAPVSISTNLASVHSAGPNAAPAGAGAGLTDSAAAEGGQVGQATTVYTIPASGSGPATLWDIAETHLGAGERWHEIWQLNQGRVQPGGATMTSPRRLLPGWTVLVPAPASLTGAASETATTPTPAGAAPAGPTSAAEVTVHTGDTLSELSAEHGQRDWHRTWQANAGRAEPAGARYTDPDLIRPGWRLTIPANAGPADEPAVGSLATPGPAATAPVAPPPVALPPAAPTPPPQRRRARRRPPPRRRPLLRSLRFLGVALQPPRAAPRRLPPVPLPPCRRADRHPW